jgi:hypothetical protein
MERKKVQNHEKPVFSHFENHHHFENIVMWQKQYILRCVIFLIDFFWLFLINGLQKIQNGGRFDYFSLKKSIEWTFLLQKSQFF